jgi:hypothetical protein
MGREKEEQVVREERARQRAREVGHVCWVCGQPLLTSEERTSKTCAYHTHVFEKDD